jgi:hypothetical protein
MEGYMMGIVVGSPFFCGGDDVFDARLLARHVIFSNDGILVDGVR